MLPFPKLPSATRFAQQEPGKYETYLSTERFASGRQIQSCFATLILTTTLYPRHVVTCFILFHFIPGVQETNAEVKAIGPPN